MKASSHALLVFLLIFAIAYPALAYRYPLSSEAIREAYFLGARNDEISGEAFAKYSHSLPKPSSGPYISWIGIETPFLAVANEASRSPNDHAQEAEEKFLGKPQLFRVRIEIDFTETYPNPTVPDGRNGFGVFLVPDFWRDFKIRLIQGRAIAPQAVRAGPIYSYYTADVSGIVGAEVEQDYDPEKIDSASIEIQVVTPDGHKVKTSFDLASLD